MHLLVFTASRRFLRLLFVIVVVVAPAYHTTGAEVRHKPLPHRDRDARRQADVGPARPHQEGQSATLPAEDGALGNGDHLGRGRVELGR